MVVFLNGRFLDDKKAMVSVFDHGFLYADGVYETLRTYGGFVWQPHEHLRRLRRSAELIGIVLPWSFSRLASWIDQTVKRNGYPESRIRVTITRGENGFDFGKASRPTICIQVQKLAAEAPAVYKKGVSTVSFAGERILPGAKSISLLPMVLAQRHMKKRKAYEAFFVDPKGLVREGTVTNVFMVASGVLITPGKGILAGTTRDALLKLARRLDVKVRVRDVKLREMYGADEVFITNAPRGIIPVRQIDGRKIGRSCPGPVTRVLSRAFKRKCEEFVAARSRRHV